MESELSEEFEAVLIETVGWVRPAEGNHVAFEMSDGHVSNVFVLDGVQAEKLAEGLMAHLPPAPGEQIQITVPDGLSGDVQVDEVVVAGPGSQQSDEPFVLRFQAKEGTVLTLKMSHREVLRWMRRLQAQVADYHRRHGN